VDHDAVRAVEPDPVTDQPGGVLEVVVPQEVVRDREAAVPHRPGVAHHRDERRRADRRTPDQRGRPELRLRGTRSRPRRVHRVVPAVGPHDAVGQHRRRPAGAVVVAGPCRDQPLGGRRLGNGVVVEQPEQLRVVAEGASDARGETTGTADVPAQPDQVEVTVALGEQRAGPVGAGVVDDDDLGRCEGLRGQRRERLLQQLAPVPRDYDSDDPGTHPSDPTRQQALDRLSAALAA
jgi:hypothetical protein